MRRFALRASMTALVFLLCVPAAHATALSFSGTFSQDDDRWESFFTLLSPTNVLVQTLSYAGGVDPNGPVVISAGGFAPVLSLFDPSDALLAYDTGGVVGGVPACGPRGIDPTSGFCLDAVLSADLGPGTYRLVLTEWDNTPSGSAYSDGFLRDGQGNFTDIGFGPFTDPGWNPRSPAFAVSLVETSRAVPEPSTALLAVGGLLCLGTSVRLRTGKFFRGCER